MSKKIYVHDFPDPVSALDQLQGKPTATAREEEQLGTSISNEGVEVRSTHEGVVLSGLLPQTVVPPHVLVKDEDENLFRESLNPSASAAARRQQKQIQQQRQQQEPQEEENDETPPPKSLSWLHRWIEDFFEFRTKQFDIKQGAALSFALSDETGRAQRMIVPSPITDDVAFYLFEMISERYGVASVVAQHCDTVLRTAKFFSTRDVSASLFFALLRSSNFDSNDIRFVVEVKRVLRPCLVSQRGVDGILRWFVPLRLVPHLVRKACDHHPWTKPVLPKVYSAFERLLRQQQMKAKILVEEQQEQQQQPQQQKQQNISKSKQLFPPPPNRQMHQNQQQPLFTLPAPHHLNLVPPFAEDHPLVGRGPFVDIRHVELFFGSQPQQLVIGSDYLTCLLFVNWLDYREQLLNEAAAGFPCSTSSSASTTPRNNVNNNYSAATATTNSSSATTTTGATIMNRRSGKVNCEMTVKGQEASDIGKLAMFALDLEPTKPKESSLFDFDCSLQTGGEGNNNNNNNNNPNENNSEKRSSSDSSIGHSSSPAAAHLEQNISSVLANQSQTAGRRRSGGITQKKTIERPPPRILHLYNTQ